MPVFLETNHAATEHLHVDLGSFSARHGMTGRRSRPLVVFCMQWVPSYREAFYSLLRDELESRGIDMIVVHGAPPASRRRRNDSVAPRWATFIANRSVTIGSLELTWQPVWPIARRAELIVVQQEAAFLFNYAALLRRRVGGPPVAMWGHGENSNHRDQNRIAESLKRTATPLADWFFAYTDRSAEIVGSLGMEQSSVTVVNNARTSDASLDPADASPELLALLDEIRGRSSHVGWMVSALDTWKRLPYLIDVLDEIRDRVDDFEFLVLGQGDDESVVFEAAAKRPWLHALGSRFGPDKAAVGKLADITIQPGLVGLHVIDAFAFETPMVTVASDIHSHEFDYLVDGENALVLTNGATPAELAEATTRLFSEPATLERLRRGCKASAQTYTIESMVERFANGIENAIRTSQGGGQRERRSFRSST